MRLLPNLSAAMFLASTAAPALAQAPSVAPVAEEGHWVSLFDGKTLNGWVADPVTQKGQFSVRDGVIHIEGSPQGGWLRTDRKYTDFTLRYQVRYVSPDHIGNTGLILRSPEISISGRNWPGRGFEMESRDMNNAGAMLPWEGNILALQPGAPLGRFSFDTEAARRSQRPTGEWNDVEIIVHGNRMWTRINGEWLATAYNVAHPDGHLGFQAEDGVVEYRALSILEHARDSVTPETWVPLFADGQMSGLDLSDQRYAGNMAIANGVLRFKGAGGWLRTRAPYTSYTLRMEFRALSDDADSGVFLRAPLGKDDADGWPTGTAEAQLRHQTNPLPTEAAGDRRWLGAFLRRGGTEGPVTIDTDAVVHAYRGLNVWQTAEIEVSGRNALFRLNGQLLGEAQNIANPAGGYVGIQMGPGTIEFRTIEIKGFASDAAPAAGRP